MIETLSIIWEFYRDPILCAVAAGAVLGLLGVYVVSRRIVFVSAALSQVAALGIVGGFFLVASMSLSGVLAGIVPVGLALLLALAVVFALAWVGDRPSIGRDAILGIAFIVPTALVLVVGPQIPQEMHSVEQILHGSAVLVRKADLWAVLIAGALVIATQLAAFRGFVFASLDPIVARTQGVPVKALDLVLFGSIAIMTGLVTRALGALPTFGLTVLPAIGVLGLKIGLRNVFVLAALIGAVSGAGGYLLAYFLDWSVGASQTLVAAGFAVLLRSVGVVMHR
ncbi:metal ABC transporter permease [Persicimonas caeni]|uniref:Metal ABC transporter permease n=1 Tax=Persicimonas caeni TaxID=2292766 RepID=A0A4Y6PSY3_PERCE|nr:metal ABC transporter permease [Persicimonas caeni]QDG51418.1 metal ABC transporter permease [Persicimonas caeni]QED32639.1 metal ABC transporter permease [Persicimonas caeni]